MKHVLCVSWDQSLATTREMLLRNAGYRVISALGPVEAARLCQQPADLLVLGHSVPPLEKQQIIRTFREHSTSPVLSLLRHGQAKLPEATYGVEAGNPAELIETVTGIVPPQAAG